jgi:hypothetical protein
VTFRELLPLKIVMVWNTKWGMKVFGKAFGFDCFECDSVKLLVEKC